jgi:transglutaminase-like putative cysteine protease
VKSILTTICIAALLTTTNAQNNSEKKSMVWGETDVVDRRMTTYANDPSANAAVLDAVTRLRFEMRDNRPQLTVQVHRRIKVLNDNAISGLMTINLPINVPANRVTMGTIKAQLVDINDNPQVIPIEESKDGNVSRLTVSQIQSGYILEYRYDFTTDSVPALTNWAFQEQLPIRRAELWANISAAFNYTFTYQNKDKINAFTDSKSNAKVFVVTDMPAVSLKANSLISSAYGTAVRFQINSASTIAYGKQNLSTSWRDLAQSLQKQDNLGAQYQQKSNYNAIWEAMQPYVSVAKNTEEKIKAAYNFINKTVEWDGEWSIYSRESLNKVYENGKGNSGEMNLMLIACLNAAGIRAQPMFVSTRPHGKVNVNTAFAGQFDHLVCYTELNGAPCFLDAGEASRPIGMLRVEALNNDAWVMDNTNPIWIKINPTLSVRQTLSTFSLSKEGDLRGRFVKTSKGYEAVLERNDQSRKNTMKLLQREYTGIRIDSVTTVNLDANLSNPFKRNFYVAIPQAVEAVDNKMTIKPLWRTGLEDQILPTQTPVPVDFAYPISDMHVFNLAIPEGASVDKMPRDESLELADKSATYQFTAVQSGNVVQLTIRVQVDRLHFEAADYNKIKELFDRIAAKQTEVVVLRNVKTEPISSRR